MMIKKRNTLQRKLVYESVCELGNHPTADEVYELVAARHPKISKGTVYRNLNSLAEDGDLRRINIPNAPDRFDHNIDPHYHIKCKECGAFYDVDANSLGGVENQILDRTGFVVQPHDLVFLGTCPKCR